MLEPRLIEFHLSKVQKEIGEGSTLANTYFRLVKPIEENLKRYSNLEKESAHSILLSILFAPFKISLEILKSLGVAVLRLRESSGFEVRDGFQNQRIFVSHYTHAQVPSQPDVFFDQLPSKNDLIFYHNNTLLSRPKILSNLSKGRFRPNISVTTKSLGVGHTVRLQAINLNVSRKMLTMALDTRRFTPLERQILVNASSAQVSRQTLANQVNLKRLDSLLAVNNPSTLVITLEGHAYEALYIDIIHSRYPETQLMVFQHAPIVPEQFGLMRNLLKLNSSDVILSSGEITNEFFASLGLSASVRLLGSPKWRPLSQEPKTSFPITVLGAAEGTVESLENFSRLFESLSTLDMGLKLILRLHPALLKKECSKILSKLDFGEKLILSTQTLEQDLKDSHFCIYRSSAVAIEGLRYGVFPLYFNPTGDQGLNPLYFAKLEVPVFRNLSEFQELFLNLRETGSKAAQNQNEDLLKIGAAYYSKLDSSALNRL
jgi:hypothetical protein